MDGVGVVARVGLSHGNPKGWESTTTSTTMQGKENGQADRGQCFLGVEVLLGDWQLRRKPRSSRLHAVAFDRGRWLAGLARQGKALGRS